MMIAETRGVSGEKVVPPQPVRGPLLATTWSAGMASTLARTIAPDIVISFDINPGTLLQFLDSRAEGGPRLKCFEGSVTLVSPGKPHETTSSRLDLLDPGRLPRASASGTRVWPRPPGHCPFGAGDTAYEADKAYYIQSQGTEKRHQPPDLAIEVVVSHSEKKALRAGAFLKIPEMWVLDIPRHRLTFYHLVVRGQTEGHVQAADLGAGPSRC